MTRSALKGAVVSVLAVTIAAGWLARPSAQKRTTSSTVEPFHTGLTIVVPPNTETATGSGSFQVPAGKRLNLRQITFEHTILAGVQIETAINGETVTHYVANRFEQAYPLYLWADDTGAVTVRISYSTTSNPLAQTWHVSLTGELY
jgi:hypothetical protein